MLRVGEVTDNKIRGFTIAGSPVELAHNVGAIVEAIHCIFLAANPDAAEEFRLAAELTLQDPSLWDGHGELSGGETLVVSYPRKREKEAD